MPASAIGKEVLLIFFPLLDGAELGVLFQDIFLVSRYPSQASEAEGT